MWLAGLLCQTPANEDAAVGVAADKRAFVNDGLPYNWTIQQRHFSGFTAILDFVHVVEHLYEAARCLHADADRRWDEHQGWTQACWSGQVDQVISEMK